MPSTRRLTLQAFYAQLAGEAGYALCAQRLRWFGGPGELFAAAVLAVTSPREPWLHVFAAYSDDAQLRALASALGYKSDKPSLQRPTHDRVCGLPLKAALTCRIFRSSRDMHS